MMSQEKLRTQIDLLEPQIQEAWANMMAKEKDPNASEHERWLATSDYMQLVAYFSAMVDVMIG